MTKDELIDAVMREMDRVWGTKGLHGTPDEYAWLLTHYGITAEEDSRWMDVLYASTDRLPRGEPENEEVTRFLNDDQALRAFLEQLLQKYRSNTVTRNE